MQIEYTSDRIKKICTSPKAAQKYFGGNKDLANHLLSRINLFRNAPTLKDIIMSPQCRFHKLNGNRAGYFAIDVKSPKEPWRIILQPLKEDKNVYKPCHIDEIANIVTIIEVTEVSKHYE